MGTICKVGETKRIKGKLYRKAPVAGPGLCSKCAFLNGNCPGNSVGDAIEDGGSECRGSIWEEVPAPALNGRTKPKAAKHVWTKIPHPEITIRTTKRMILKRLGEILDKANDLGTENAKLKNQIVSLKKKGTK